MITFSATFFDGVRSTGIPVRLEVNDEGILSIHGLDVLQTYALKDVELEARLGNTVRKITLPGGATCESSDHERLDELLHSSRRGRAGTWLHRVESTWRVAIVSAAILILLVIAGTRWGIPVAAKYLAQAIPQELAYDLGRGSLAMLDDTLLHPSALTQERRFDLSKRFARIAKNYQVLPLTLHFRRGIGPNAFALPNGAVIVTDELVGLAKDDLEIDSVILHEIGHVDRRHALRMALETSSFIILVSTYLGDVSQLSALSSSLPGIVAQQHYSREHETEADDFAMQQMDRLGIPRSHFARILSALDNALGHEKNRKTEYLDSHPATMERIRRFRG
jgi:Zn-dependent protease with chaperone function